MGECLVELGRYRDAIIPLAAATALNRGVRAPSLLAEVFLRLADCHDALTMADEALSRDPRNKRARSVKDAVLAFEAAM